MKSMEMATLTPESIEEASKRLPDLSAIERVRWAHEVFGDKMVMSTSFGVQSAVMLHLVTSIAPDIPVVFIDTGYLFPETYKFADELTQRLNLNLKVYNPKMTAARQEALYGKRWEMEREKLEEYNLMNKVEPMNRAVNELGAEVWLSGLRHAQSSTRQNLRPLELQNKTYKLYPIIEWSEREIYQYLQAQGLPYHPLWDEGYVSVGDVHSTSKLTPGMSQEETRFGGVKRECGLHELSNQNDFQI